MSRERARRRAERESRLAAERERRRRQVARADARRTVVRRLDSRVRRPVRSSRGRVDSPLRRQRRRQDAVLLGMLFVVHVALWLFTDSWLWRISALVLTLMSWPLLVTLLYDRRSR